MDLNARHTVDGRKIRSHQVETMVETKMVSTWFVGVYKGIMVAKSDRTKGMVNPLKNWRLPNSMGTSKVDT